MSDEEKLREYLRRAIAELQETRQRLHEAEDRGREPIAIVAMGCRYPGGVRSPRDLWDLVRDGADAITGFPQNRGWDLDGTGPGDALPAAGGFLHDAGEFDPGFFGISPREALAMDPQQRLLLETSWEVFEGAGIVPESLAGSETGVFVGTGHGGYDTGSGGDHDEVAGHLLTGNTVSVASGRISFVYGLEGPAVTVDTACSSSLVALHMAMRSLRSGECSLALAGGATVMSTPAMFTEFARQGALASDGRCKPFAAAADGTSWGEGVGLLLVERLSDARRNGHPVLAVLRGSAINQDGASNGLTAPNGPSQQRVIRAALADAGVTAAEVDAVEAHGTGTRLGDPIEAQALLAAYGRDRDRPLLLGSVKSNIGHTQAAAGVAGVMKMVLAMRHGVLPRTLHIDEPTPHVDWTAGRIELLSEPAAWPERDGTRLAAVSAFGVSGTNAHVIVQQAPAADPDPDPAADPADAGDPGGRFVPWVLSGKSPRAVRDQADRLAAHLRDAAPDARPVDVAYSLATARTAMDHRAAVVARDRDGFLAALGTVTGGETAPGGDGAPVFVFPGQGAQWAGMAVELLDTAPVFAARMRECEEALAPHVDWSLAGVLRGAPDAPPLDRVDVVQPALFAVMVSLAALWRAHGVEPAAVIGHSQGEIAAACVAGALSLEDAARVVALRSRALTALAGGGAMASVALPAAAMRDRLAGRAGNLSVAAVNSPGSVVVSGDADAVDRLVADCEGDGIWARKVPVDYASHSAHVARIRGELLDVLAPITPRRADVPLYSTVTGAAIDTGGLDAEYWYRNLSGTVEFEAAVRAALADGHRVLIEVGAHPVLTTALRETAEDAGVAAGVTGTLRRGEGGMERFATSLADAWTQGARVDWDAFFAGSGARGVETPTYPFQREHFWLRSASSSAGSGGWCYRATWTPVTGAAAGGTPRGHWLVALPAHTGDGAGDSAWVAGLLDGLAERGMSIERLPLPGGEDRAAVAERIAQAVAERPLAGVLSLLALDERPLPGHPSVSSGLDATGALAQALAAADADVPLWCATRGAVAADRADTLTSPAQAQVWGLGRVVALEYPRGWGGLVDLPGDLDGRAVALLAGVLADGREDQVAVRGTGVLARRITHVPVEEDAAGADAAGRWTPPPGTVLITGGTGALGGHVARWLAEAGAEHLVLAGRRGPAAPGAAELEAELAALGARVTVAACDVADRDALARLLDGIPDLAGVVHTAGVLDDGVLESLRPDRFEAVLRPKARAAANLDELTRDRDPAMFVLFSSIVGVLGNGGQANYAAANAYLDALAERRRAEGLAATSVAWGPWADAGLAAGDAMLDDRMRRGGLRPMAPAAAIAALHRAVAADMTAVTVADIDWDPYSRALTAARPSPLIGDLPEVRRAMEARDSEPAGGLRERLGGLSAAEQERLLVDTVRSTVARVLGHLSAETVDTDRAFRELGFDSLTAVEARNRLSAAAGIPLATTLLFDYPTVRAVARHLRSELLGEPGVAVAAVPAPADVDEPVAIVAMACRFPGGVRTPDGLWDLVRDGLDVVSGPPPERGWDLDAVYDPDPDREGTTYCREGGFIDDIAGFDPEFFGISPREAIATDPQHRLLLETSWEAFERAGIDPRTLRGGSTGVFVGTISQDYQDLLRRTGENFEGRLMTGNAASISSGRVSYVFGLEGPAVTLDTGCSSSLVALHLAMRSLRSGECSLALAGGVTVMTTPDCFVDFSRQRGLAADGRCKAFSAAADGMGFAEGVAMLLVERLSDARRNGHPVLAVVRGSAINQDGASNGLTAPNGPSQQRVIRAALADAGVTAAEVDAVEAHGTGTRLGDPIEAQALLATYGQGREKPLLLGSLKSNIGHTQAAAGVAGVMKMVLAMRHGVLPRTLHAEERTAQVDWSAGAVELLTEPAAWPAGDRPRLAAVSSFGISGTNAHLILEEAPETDPPADAPADPPADAAPAVPWVLSAKSPQAVRDRARELAAHVRAADGIDATDIGCTLGVGRAAMDHRAAVVGADRDEFLAGLDALAEERVAGGVFEGHGEGGEGPVFVFPGQGSQWSGMAAELMATSPVFAERLGECAAALSPHIDWSLVDVLRGAPDAPPLDRVDVVQPALFAVMVSLAALWRAQGVEPAAVVGHSQGEIAAACVAGALSLADAARIVALRSRALTRLAGRGAMASVALPARDVRERLITWSERTGRDGRLSLAAVNGPGSVVVSGDAAAVEEFAAGCRDEGVRVRVIPVDYASHSADVEEIRDELLRVLEPITPRAPEIPFHSTVGGAVSRAMDAEYWYRNLRETVEFEPATRALLDAGHRLFIEVSPHPVLITGLQETLHNAGVGGAVVGTLRRGESEHARFCASLAEAWTRGAPVDWDAYFADSGARTVELPTYPFQRRPFWPRTSGAPADVASAGLGALDHPLLGAAVDIAGGGPVLAAGGGLVLAGGGLVVTARWSVRTHPWLADHAVSGVVLVPGTALLETVIRAGDELGCGRVEELALHAPLVLPEGADVQVQLTVGEPDDAGARPVAVHSRPAGEAAGTWTRHATGALAPAQPSPAPPSPGLAGDLAAWPPPGAEPVDVDGFYGVLRERGYEFGPSFQGVRAVWRRGGEVFAEVALPEEARGDAARFGLHPALLDAALQAANLAPGEDGTRTVAPFSMRGVTLHAAGAAALRVRLSPAGPDALAVEAADTAGAPVVGIESLVVRPVDTGTLDPAARAARDRLFRVEWASVQPGPVTGSAEWAVLGGDPGGTVPALAGEPGVAVLPVHAPGEPADAVIERVLALLQEWLADDRFAGDRLVVLTRGAVATGSGENVKDLPAASVWGLVRPAQSEHPGRIVLADVDGHPDSWRALPAAVASGEPQVALRRGAAYAPRLARAAADGPLPVPDAAEPWRLDIAGSGDWGTAAGSGDWGTAAGSGDWGTAAGTGDRGTAGSGDRGTVGGTVDGIALVPCPEAAAPLEPGQVRLGVRAAGLNFRDVLNTLGMYPGDPGALGAEAAGVVTETGPGVTGIAVGDRVMGLVPGGFGPVAVADARLLVPIPHGWTYAQAATVPVAFLTAYYGLHDLAGLGEGESVLVHAAAGGVGMAAAQLAAHWGADVFGTASDPKRAWLRARGWSGERLASSRTTEFADTFRGATEGRGVDVVLNSLAGEFTDASLRLLAPGGRFIEMGKTDVRDPDEVAAAHGGAAYRAFEVAEAGPERVREMLAELSALFERGALQPLPVTCWDVRHARDAFRFMSRARHIGKVVLTMPRAWDPAGTVLITGGTGVLGGLLARHLAARHGVRHLLLTSRRGPDAPGAAELRDELTALGADVTVAACDAGDRDAVAALLAAVPARHPLTAVVHAAGALDDGLLESLTPERLRTVLHPKADAARHLDELTRGLDLAGFVLFSGAAGLFGNPGQSAYGAASAYLDGLARRRRIEGLPGTSLAWGLWADASGMTGHLGDADLARVRRSGVLALSAEDGLAAFDAALAAREDALVPVRLDTGLLSARDPGDVPPLLRALHRGPARRAVEAAGDAGTRGLRHRLAGLPAAEAHGVLLDLVRTSAAAVLGHTGEDAMHAGRAFREVGFDSLTAVELRNRLGAATGLRLPATLVFDHPTPADLAAHLTAELAGTAPAAAAGTAAHARDDEPIAIVGMACRFPGGVRSPADLWTLLSAGTDAVAGFPADRGWDLDGLYGDLPDEPGFSRTREGGFLYDMADFDAGFFGIGPNEALAMDPQQRLLLETSWELFERAGIDPGSVRGTDTGVFAGLSLSDYLPRVHDVPPELAGHINSGNAVSVVSGRIAYTLGLEGPAVTVDTACSSSLVALHMAMRSLRQGECSLALAGGVTVMSSPAVIADFARQRGLAGDGRCKPYGAAADGTGFAEGVGLLLVERLSDARRNGHRVLAVLRGSAVNQDGASNGLTAPNGPAQQRVIRRALADAGVAAADIDAVEGHGTGTRLGDPIEIQALQAAYGDGRDRPLWLGSVKSNLGHTQAAAGVAGVIKMVLAMRHGTLPRSLHIDEPTPHVDWSGGPVRPLAEAEPWPDEERPRRAGVSSFGISGTNVHVILEQAPPDTAALDAVPEDAVPEDAVPAGQGPVPWLLSARTETALRAQARALLDHLDRAAPAPRDVAHTLRTGRAALEKRAVVVGADDDALRTGLAALADGAPAAGLVRGAVPAGGRRKAVLVFPGQGSQWAGMGAELLETCPPFAARIDECERALAPHVDWSLRAVLRDEDGTPPLDRVDVAQCALWAVMVAFAEVWRAHGVEPAAVIGHSQGEVAAACVAGVLSLDDAARVVAARSRAIAAELSGRGGMASVTAPRDDITAMLEPWGDRLSLAAANGPATGVVSGDAAAIGEFLDHCAERGVRAKKIPVDFASHSAAVELIRDGLLADLDGVEPREARVPFQSTVTGARLAAGEADAGYWYENLRRPVRFEEALRALLEEGHDAFIECSPHPVLTAGIEDTAADAGAAAAVIGSLRRDDGGAARVLTALAEAHVAGLPVDWRDATGGGRTVDLPAYAFQRERYWLDPAPARRSRDPLFRVEWTPLTGGPPLNGPTVNSDGPDIEVMHVAGEGGGTVASAHASARAALELLRSRLHDPDAPGSRLVLVTRGAVAAAGGDAVPAPADAVVWGLARSAQSEHPGRVLLADLDGDPASAEVLGTAAAAALAAGESELAVRAGTALVPRLARVPGGRPDRPPRPWPGTVLITGGTGVLGARIARHAVTARGARNLLLLSRRGPDAPGAAELRDELAALGAAVTVAACDAADRDALAGVIAGIPPEHPLSAVVHTAGVLDDALLENLTPERLAGVLRPKADAAWHLHELTRDAEDLVDFVLFSSYAGTAGAMAQANYAAANTFLDALAHHRNARGMPAVSLAWGPWAETSGLTAGLDESDRARIARTGLIPLTTEQALAFLDAAGSAGEAVLVPVRLDPDRVDAAAVPPLLRGLVRPAASPANGAADGAAADGLRERLAGLPPAKRDALLLDLVRGHVAALLGHRSTAAIDVERGFLDLGMSSVTAVELRNRLGAETGLRLPTTLIFDHPTPVAMARHLRAELGAGGGAPPPVFAELEGLESAVSVAELDAAARARLVERLKTLQWRLDGGDAALDRAAAPPGAGGDDDLAASTDDEMFKLIDNELGLARPAARHEPEADIDARS
ncbi:SDR family NAD(P)-dependent oxidoreductase [Actinomadura welshii]